MQQTQSSHHNQFHEYSRLNQWGGGEGEREIAGLQTLAMPTNTSCHHGSIEIKELVGPGWAQSMKLTWDLSHCNPDYHFYPTQIGKRRGREPSTWKKNSH